MSAGLIGTLNQIDQFENVHMAVADLGPKFFQFHAVFGCTVFMWLFDPIVSVVCICCYQEEHGERRSDCGLFYR